VRVCLFRHSRESVQQSRQSVTVRDHGSGRPANLVSDRTQPMVEAMVKPGWIQHTWWLVPLTFFVTLSGWALTSPVGSSPDDDYHLSSIWCSDGPQSGRCVETDSPFERAVPAAVVSASYCYRFQPEESGACSTQIPDGLRITDRINDGQGLYPTLFYRAMGVFVGPDVERSVLFMRLANALLASVLIGCVLILVPVGVRSAFLITMVVTAIPLGLSIIASTNPSSWSIMGLATFWAFALALLHEARLRSKRGVMLVILTIITGLMAIGSRVDAMVYLVLVVVVVSIYTGYSQIRRSVLAFGVLLALSAFGIYSYFTFGTPGGAEPMGTSTASTSGLLVTNTLYLPSLYQGVVGGWAIGWNDTEMPAFIPVMGVLALGALGYRGLLVLQPRKIFAAVFAVAMMFAVPLAFLQKEGLEVGEVVQPRYLLPLLILAIATLSLGRTVQDALELPMPIAVVLAIALSVSAGLAFWTNAHRYATGLDVPLLTMNWEIEWSHGSGVPLGLIAPITILASIGFVTISMAAVRYWGFAVREPAGAPGTD